MKVCFIADSTSIHVRRIVAFFVGQRDDVLIISTAPERADIAGTKTLYLLDVSRSCRPSSESDHPRTGVLQYLKSFVPDSFKSLIHFNLGSMKLLRERATCLNAIEQFDPDVIYSFRCFPEGLLASYNHVRPMILRTAGPDISLFPKYPVFRQLTRRALKAADIVVTESNWERQLLKKLCGDAVDAEVNLIGIDTEVFRPMEARASIRAKYHIPQNALVLMTNRYLDGWYNGWLVVEAIEAILDECPNLVMVYITPLPMSPAKRIQAQIVMSRSPRIKFLEGPLSHPELAELLGCADLYTSFASFDGIPNSLLEAMACGAVPVVAELPQLHEWVDHGITGYVVPQRDTKALGRIVRRLYDHPHSLPSLSARCIAKVRDNASYRDCMERNRKLLQSLNVNRPSIPVEKPMPLPAEAKLSRY